MDTKETTRSSQETNTCVEDINNASLAFSTFLISLSTSVLVCLGELPDPLTNEKSMNIPLAKQTIGIIEMLNTKTRGNLSEEENKLLGDILYDLRMKYIKVAC